MSFVYCKSDRVLYPVESLFQCLFDRGSGEQRTLITMIGEEHDRRSVDNIPWEVSSPEKGITVSDFILTGVMGGGSKVCVELGSQGDENSVYSLTLKKVVRSLIDRGYENRIIYFDIRRRLLGMSRQNLLYNQSLLRDGKPIPLNEAEAYIWEKDPDRDGWGHTRQIIPTISEENYSLKVCKMLEECKLDCERYFGRAREIAGHKLLRTDKRLWFQFVKELKYGWMKLCDLNLLSIVLSRHYIESEVFILIGYKHSSNLRKYLSQVSQIIVDEN